MRLIDADALKKTLRDWIRDHWTEAFTGDDAGWEFTDMIERAETIDANPTVHAHWIPCSERLPEEKDAGILKKLGTSKRSEYVLATVEVKGERMTVTVCTYDGEWDWNMKYAFPDYKIIAWMPFPEPYREERTEE